VLEPPPQRARAKAATDKMSKADREVHLKRDLPVLLRFWRCTRESPGHARRPILPQSHRDTEEIEEYRKAAAKGRAADTDQRSEGKAKYSSLSRADEAWINLATELVAAGFWTAAPISRWTKNEFNVVLLFISARTVRAYDLY
jgi:hypothetical protein